MQVRLYETSNIIRFKYQDVVFGGTQNFYDNGVDAVVGIEGPSSISPRPYNTWSCNTAGLNDGLCIEFAPPPPCVLTVPANMTVAMDPDICGAVVNFTVSASDNCGPVTVTPASGSVFLQEQLQ
ncbi:MAG: hypothetical protein IPH57_09125 [Saprospiraceae bacterium]|nr:hypothetical protein [Saprospiraceae bacterium]